MKGSRQSVAAGNRFSAPPHESGYGPPLRPCLALSPDSRPSPVDPSPEASLRPRPTPRRTPVMTRRIIMSMFTGATLLASTLLGASPAQAADVPAEFADVPAEFGTDWHDPVTAAPPVTRPDTASCEVTVAEARFRDFTPYQGAYAPPQGCGDRWSKVVLRLDGKVKGRQYDRLGHLHVGGVEILRTSTPQPSPDGIEWSVEKDVTRYSPTLRSPQPVEMLIGNVVDDTYTGVIDVKVTLTFYSPAEASPAEKHPAAQPPTPTPRPCPPPRPPEPPSPPPATANASSPRCTPPARAAAARSTGT
ncbi:hypothetical protein GCM10020295_10340 [Streptomyces cinereospinus]